MEYPRVSITPQVGHRRKSDSAVQTQKGLRSESGDPEQFEYPESTDVDQELTRHEVSRFWPIETSRRYLDEYATGLRG